MEVITAVAAWAISSACQNLPVARDLLGALCAPVIGDVAALQNSLSPAAKVYLPGSNDFDILSERWSLLGSPKGNLVVVPATDNDVSETVSMSFLELCLSTFVAFLTRIIPIRTSWTPALHILT